MVFAACRCRPDRRDRHLRRWRLRNQRTLTEKRIKAVVSITGVNVGRLFHESFSNYDPLDAMAAQRTKEVRGGELRVDELLPASPDGSGFAQHVEVADTEVRIM